MKKPHIEKTKVGSEVIDGHPTDKYRVTMTYKNGRTEEGFIWNARDLEEMTIRSEIENKDSRVRTELKNISLEDAAGVAVRDARRLHRRRRASWN